MLIAILFTGLRQRCLVIILARHRTLLEQQGNFILTCIFDCFRMCPNLKLLEKLLLFISIKHDFMLEYCCRGSVYVTHYKILT